MAIVETKKPSSYTLNIHVLYLYLENKNNVYHYIVIFIFAIFPWCFLESYTLWKLTALPKKIMRLEDNSFLRFGAVLWPFSEANSSTRPGGEKVGPDAQISMLSFPYMVWPDRRCAVIEKLVHRWLWKRGLWLSPQPSIESLSWGGGAVCTKVVKKRSLDLLWSLVCYLSVCRVTRWECWLPLPLPSSPQPQVWRNSSLINPTQPPLAASHGGKAKGEPHSLWAELMKSVATKNNWRKYSIEVI